MSSFASIDGLVECCDPPFANHGASAKLATRIDLRQGDTASHIALERNQMRQIALESTFKVMEREIKHLWEGINVVVQACDACCRLTGECENCARPLFSILHIGGNSRNLLGKGEAKSVLRNISERRANEWGLIVAVSCFDAWLEDTVNRIHGAYPQLKSLANKRNYRFNTPSFSRQFFSKDQAAIGLQFPPADALIERYIELKETRNLFIHKGGRISSRFKADFRTSYSEGQKINLDLGNTRRSLATILELAVVVRKQLRRELKKLAKVAHGQPAKVAADPK